MTAKTYSCPKCGREATTKNARVGKGNLLRLAIALLLIAACGNVSAIVCKRFRDYRTVLEDDAYEAFVATHSNEVCFLGVNMNGGRGSNIKYLPHAFTEMGLYMLATVLNSPRAIQATHAIIETYAEVRAIKRELRAMHEERDEQGFCPLEAVANAPSAGTQVQPDHHGTPVKCYCCCG